MHPVIRILSFLVFTLFISRAVAIELAVAAVLLSGCMLVVDSASLVNAWRMLIRLRWLFASILVIYFWFTPGETPVIAGFDSTWLPSLAGMHLGAQRVATLVLIVMAVNLLLAVTMRPDLLSALVWLGYPLKYLGVPAERLALRLVLTLETVPEVQTLLEQRLGELRGGKGIRGIGDSLASLFTDITQRVAALPTRQVNIALPVTPALWQWFIPLAIAGAFLLI
jgi:energy-coupling factor transport system permease protein